MIRISASVLLCLLAAAGLVGPATAQVHYHPNGRPWTIQARSGPDAEVEGWLYNLGLTGIRVKLIEEEPTHLVVGHVFEGSRAEGKVRVGDHIIGAGGRPFQTPHQNGYGMKVFGPEGPIADFAAALERALDDDDRELRLELLRDGEKVGARLEFARRDRRFSDSFPFDCKKTAEAREKLYAYLVEEQRQDGSWGGPIQDVFAPLALLGSGKREYLKAVERNARFHGKNTTREGAKGGLVNWRYMSAGIVLSEWYLASKESWVLEELQEVYDFLITSQYTDLSQVSEKSRESHPHAYPKNAEQKHGGWGHNPGFEGYGPIAMTTGQGALVFALMDRCGIEVDPERHRAAYAYLARGTGRNGYLWYADEVAGHQNWADMGRTGASAIAHWMSPFKESRKLARLQSSVMGEHPESFPDTHASPLQGMGFGALGAYPDRKSFKSIMAANRWWFLLAECADGTFHYQPNRDNSGYPGNSRLVASAVTAFILTLPEGGLEMTAGS